MDSGDVLESRNIYIGCDNSRFILELLLSKKKLHEQAADMRRTIKGTVRYNLLLALAIRPELGKLMNDAYKKISFYLGHTLSRLRLTAINTILDESNIELTL